MLMDSIVNFLITTCRAVMFAKNLLPYEENRDRFSTNSKRPRRGFKEALVDRVPSDHLDALPPHRKDLAYRLSSLCRWSDAW